MAISTGRISPELIPQNKRQKTFTEKALIRILLGVEREIAIGAIINSGLYRRNQILELLDQVLEELFPEILLNVINKISPGFLTNLKFFIATLVWKWLALLPDEDLSIEYDRLAYVPEKKSRSAAEEKLDQITLFLDQGVVKYSNKVTAQVKAGKSNSDLAHQYRGYVYAYREAVNYLRRL